MSVSPQLGAILSRLERRRGAGEHVPDGGPLGYAARINAALGLKVTLPEADLERVASSGGLLLLAGRPYGLVEACALLPQLLARRPDLRVLRDTLMEADGLCRDLTLGPGGDPERWDRAEEHLRQGGAVLAFVQAPLAAGKAGSARAQVEALRLARLARASGATLQALCLDGGKRRPWLRALGLDKPGQRRLALGSALRRAVPRLSVRVGGGLGPARLRQVPRDQDAAELLVWRFWLLAHRGSSARRSAPWRERLRRLKRRPLASPLPPELLEAELERLPSSAKLAFAGTLECWAAPAAAIPGLLREIGRLREESFRAVGEGSGQPLDLDRFDQHYLQLFLWDKASRCVVGGYRFAAMDQVLEAHGPEGLYAHSLLRFKPELLAQLDPALELGRSFVVPAWQRSYGPLLLLWRGLGAWISANPRYRRLYGLVSMSAEFQDLSRELVASFVKQHLYRGDLARLTRPRRPYLPGYVEGKHDSLTWRLGSNLDEISRWVSELEPDGKGLPVLFRQYANLGGFFFGFNVDPAFGHAMDGLVCVDLLQAEPRMLARTMGAEESKDYLAWHGRAVPA